MITKLIHCKRCNQVVPNYRPQELAEMNSLPGVKWSDADVKAAGAFYKTHSRHPLQELSIIEGSQCMAKEPSPRSGVTYLVAASGKRKFLVKRMKPRFDTPASYALLPGGLEVTNVSVKIEEESLRQQIEAEKDFSPQMKRKMEILISAFRQEVAAISPEDFEKEVRVVEEGESSLAAYATLDKPAWERIVNRCRREFTASELRILQRFIEENNHPTDVLAIVIHRKLSLIPFMDIESEAVWDKIKGMDVRIRKEPAVPVRKKPSPKHH